MSSAWTRLASFSLTPSCTLTIIRGSVVDFNPSIQKAAIVNAANPACLGGGGVDGAITTAGGAILHQHRMALPLISKGVRCPTGHAKVTGPGDYGELHVPYVIHAVGPCYFDYDQLSEGDALLASAYASTMDQAHANQIERVAFSLLSAGIYKGEQTLKNVLTIGITSIHEWMQQHATETSLTNVYLCGFNARECNALVDICEDDLKLQLVTEEEEENDAMMMNGADGEEETNDNANHANDDNNSESRKDTSSANATNETKEESGNDAAMDSDAQQENGDSNGAAPTETNETSNGETNATGDNEDEKDTNKRKSNEL